MSEKHGNKSNELRGMKNYTPTKQVEILSIDFNGPLPTSKGGFECILSRIDVFSKSVYLYTSRRMTTEVAINKIINAHIPKYG